MTLLSFVNITLSLGVVLGQMFILTVVVWAVFFSKKYPVITAFLSKQGMLLAFLVSLISVCGSLFYSQIAGFAPCELCWFQRVFMYPQVILLGLALWKKDRCITFYALALAMIGTAISLYHNYIYYVNGGLNAYCNVAEGTTSCIVRYVFEFGYVTIPVMALTAFALVIMLLVFANHETASA